MLSLTAVKAMLDAGLVWAPTELDFFAIQLSGFEDPIFAISNDRTCRTDPRSDGA